MSKLSSIHRHIDTKPQLEMKLDHFKKAVLEILSPNKGHGMLLKQFETEFTTRHNCVIPLYGFPNVYELLKLFLADVIEFVSVLF